MSRERSRLHGTRSRPCVCLRRRVFTSPPKRFFGRVKHTHNSRIAFHTLHRGQEPPENLQTLRHDKDKKVGPLSASPRFSTRSSPATSMKRFSTGGRGGWDGFKCPNRVAARADSDCPHGTFRAPLAKSSMSLLSAERTHACSVRCPFCRLSCVLGTPHLMSSKPHRSSKNPDGAAVMTNRELSEKWIFLILVGQLVDHEVVWSSSPLVLSRPRSFNTRNSLKFPRMPRGV